MEPRAGAQGLLGGLVIATAERVHAMSEALARSAESPAKATRALRTADGVAGVRDVEDQLRPLRPGVSHRQGARTEVAVLRAFISDDALPAETIHVAASPAAAGPPMVAGVEDEIRVVA
jgi:hypothetical protein